MHHSDTLELSQLRLTPVFHEDNPTQMSKYYWHDTSKTHQFSALGPACQDCLVKHVLDWSQVLRRNVSHGCPVCHLYWYRCDCWELQMYLSYPANCTPWLTSQWELLRFQQVSLSGLTKPRRLCNCWKDMPIASGIGARRVIQLPTSFCDWHCDRQIVKWVRICFVRAGCCCSNVQRRKSFCLTYQRCGCSWYQRRCTEERRTQNVILDGDLGSPLCAREWRT